jgi:hypothetical protein
MTLQAPDGLPPRLVHIRWRDRHRWVTFEDTTAGPATINAPREEFLALLRTVESAPYPVWHTDANGNRCWQNPAFSALHARVLGRDADPAAQLFAHADPARPNRFSLRIDGAPRPGWYEVTSVEADGITVHHAANIDAVVEAEEAQRSFVQTLAKTFAHLSIGLAIFDRKRQLVLFNPALVDLTGLPAQVLSQRPTMQSFFDHLRENRRMPEPKDYSTWRQEIANVIAAATDGQYHETWTLEGGQTYAVTGRRHPDGATAFLLEDISAEITLTRNFRTELEQGQAVLDEIEEGLVVFSASGVLKVSNAAYRRIWAHRPDTTFADVTVTDAIAVWKGQVRQDPGWQRITEFVRCQGSRDAHVFQALMADGHKLACTMTRLPQGATLIRFRPERAAVLAKGDALAALLSRE